jgi:hypothetical protein
MFRNNQIQLAFMSALPSLMQLKKTKNRRTQIIIEDSILKITSRDYFMKI